MRLGLGLNMLAAIQNSGSTPTPTPSIVTSAYADGYSVLPVSPAAVYFPDDPAQRVTFPTIEKGYDAAGTLRTDLSRTVTMTMRCRNTPFKFGNANDFGELDAVTKLGTQTGKTAVSHWIFTTTSGVGTNNSTLVAPKPIPACLNPGRQAIRDDGSGHYYITLEWVAFTHNANFGAVPTQTAPRLEYRVTDSAGTVGAWTAATWYDELPSGIARTSVCGFYAKPDLAAFANGDGFIDWRVYPAFGDSASIVSTLDATKNRSIKVVPFTKFAAGATQIYIASTGNDSTGNGTAGAPYLTAGKALTILGANRNGGEVLVMDSLSWGAVAATGAVANSSWLTIRKDPNTVGAVTLTLPASNTGTNTKYVRFLDITVVRGGAVWFTVNTGGAFLFDVGSTLDINNIGTVEFTNQQADFLFVGSTLARYNSTALQGTTHVDCPLMYGLLCANGINTNNGIAMYTVVGCNLTGLRMTQGSNPLTMSGMVIAFNMIRGLNGSNDIFNPGPEANGTLLSDLAFVANEIEWTGNVSAVSWGISRDPSPTYGTRNIIEWSTGTASIGVAGRINTFYNNNPSGGNERQHDIADIRGDIFPTYNIKGGQFVGVEGADPTTAAIRVGNLGHIYGTGYSDNVILYKDASGGWANADYTHDFSQLYAGLNTYVGTVTTTRSDVWTTYAAVTYNGSTYSVGAGNSVLTVKDASAPQYLRLPAPIIPKTLGGTARTSPDNAGPRGLVN